MMTDSFLQRCIVAGCLAAVLPLGACDTHPSTSPDEQGAEPLGQAESASTTLPATFSRLLPWGAAAHELGLRERAPEVVAFGPNAVAVTPQGRALLLDSLNSRVLLVGHQGQPRIAATVPVDSEDLVAGADGSFAAFSPVQATAWFYGADGAPAGEMQVPRTLRMLQRLSIGVSRTLQAHNGYQEIMRLGSPSVPMDLVATLHSKLEGAELLPDGRGLACHVSEDRAELWLIRQADAERERSEVVARHELPGVARAARIIGAEGTTVCMRLEQVESTPHISVERRALCMDALSGELLLEQPLPKPGLYLPRTELAMGAGRLAFIHPTADGLKLSSWRIPERSTAVGADLADEEVQP